MCKLSRLFTWALMVKVESQVFVRVNSHSVRVTSPTVRAVSQQCKSSVLCGVPPLPGYIAKIGDAIRVGLNLKSSYMPIRSKKNVLAKCPFEVNDLFLLTIIYIKKED